jgi:hypothetical protein
METNYAVQGNTLWQHNAKNLIVIPRIPAGVYTLRLNPERGFYLENTDAFDLPKKLYGNVARESERILNTFGKRPGSTGVLLAGDAGSGKTMLAKKVSVDALYLDMPTILVNSEFSGAAFNSWVQGVQQDAIVMFDEFEKVFRPEAQEEILTLLDGTVKTKKLFIFTCNDKWRVNEHMQNRPGRIFYFKEYKGLTEDFIREYLNDKLQEHLKVHIDAIVQFASTFRSFNFDILQALCEEMNRYNEGPKDALTMLNARPGFNRVDTRYQMVVESPQGHRFISPRSFNGTPLMLDGSDINVSFWIDLDTGRMAGNYNEFTGLNRLGKPKNGKTARKVEDMNLDEEFMSWSEEDMEGPQPDGSVLFINERKFKLYLVKTKEKNSDELRFLAA